MKFTKEFIDELADKLLIGLTSEENKDTLEEFEFIDSNINKINLIPGIEEVEPMSWCLDREITELRSDEFHENIDYNLLLSNADETENGEVVVPKVVN